MFIEKSPKRAEIKVIDGFTYEPKFTVCSLIVYTAYVKKLGEKKENPKNTALFHLLYELSLNTLLLYLVHCEGSYW